MRITGGVAKGLQLKFPTKSQIRPTTDRVREAIFSILASRASRWSRALDLYAGTGALGIEALSRDAGWVDFVDQEPRCCAIIKQNLEKARFAQKAHVYCCNVSKALAFLEGNYDIIFMDPPYSDTTTGNLLMQLDKSKYINDESLIVIPHASRSPLAESYGEWRLIKERRHGDTTISIYCREGYN
jgi:16S rRNA (guanine(966)-N(2))-methyltransferase RsmD